MNIKDALLESKANGGRAYSRKKPDVGTVGWVAFDAETGACCIYRLTWEDLTADDWEPSSDTVARITNGRWASAR
jgi:hypothetical protein